MQLLSQLNTWYRRILDPFIQLFNRIDSAVKCLTLSQDKTPKCLTCCFGFNHKEKVKLEKKNRLKTHTTPQRFQYFSFWHQPN